MSRLFLTDRQRLESTTSGKLVSSSAHVFFFFRFGMTGSVTDFSQTEF